MKKTKLKIYCTGCNSKIDVTDQASFSMVNCPACSTALTVPKRLGDVCLLRKLSVDGDLENFYGLDNEKEVKVTVLNNFSKEKAEKLKLHIEKSDSGIHTKSIGKNVVFIRPWYKDKITPFKSGSDLNPKSVLKLFTRISREMESYCKKDFYFNKIHPGRIYDHCGEIKLTDSIFLSDPKKNELKEVICETGKVFNYLLFDHSEDYEKWTEQYLKEDAEKNYYQFPWVLKGERSEALKKIVRKMLLNPGSFSSFEEISAKLKEIDSLLNINKKVDKKKKSNKKPKLNSKAEKMSAKINRSVRRSKNSNSSSLIISAAAAIAVIGLFFLLGSGSKVEKSSHRNAVKSPQTNKTTLKRDRKLSGQLHNEPSLPSDTFGKNELAEKREQERLEKLENLEEVRRQKELEKKQDLEKFLTLINPPEEVRKKFAALPAVSSSNLHSLMNKHCNDCHNSRKRKGDFVLDVFTQPSAIYNDYEVIKHAYESVKLGEMPPEDEDISGEERVLLTDYFEKIIYTLESKQIEFKSRALVRRLTPYEYDYTVKDITGLDLKLGESFPGDGGGNQGFANDAALMGVSPIQMEKFIDAAETVSRYSTFDFNRGFIFNKQQSAPDSAPEYEKKIDQKLYSHYKIFPRGFRIERFLPKLTEASAEYIFSKEKNLKAVAAKHKIPIHFLKRSTDYFSSSASKSLQELNALKKWKKLQLLRFKGDDKEMKKAVKEAAEAFLNGYRISQIELSKKHSRERARHIRFVKNVESIFHLDEDSASNFLKGKALIDYTKTLSILNFLRFAKGSADIKAVYHHFEPLVDKFLCKIYRRPPHKNDLYKKTYDLLKDSIEFGLPLASRIFVIRSLSSFNFTFRIEQKNSRKVDDYDLASRLSYFLWAGPPDNQLLSLAAEGKLNDEIILSQQIKRMIKDVKSARLAKHFASQWLRFGDILDFEGPSRKAFRGFDKNLAKDMWQESAMSFNYIVKNDRSVLEIFNADYTFVNNRLSRLYGLNQTSSSFQKVTVNNGQRGGILGHASILTTTSFGQRTSPIIRGNWILSVLLGTPTPPPPMNVDALPEEDVISKNFTLKEQLAQHRNNPACRGCHKKIDPLGIVLENYDVVGRWRSNYKQAPVDAVSKIQDMTLSGPEDLKSYLMKNKIQYMRNMSKKLLSYALGRSIYYYDNYLINKMIENAIRNDYSFSSLVRTIVLSPQFQLK